MSDSYLLVRFDISSLAADKALTQSPGLDAEDVRCISELYVLKQIMLNIQAAEGLPAIPRPADYFDLMGGTGVGG